LITIAPYDPAWPTMFELEAARLRETLGGLARRIEHVGSTAVPNLAAKPVIDIQISVASLTRDVGACTALLAAAGYAHVDLGPFDKVYPFFQRPAVWPSTHHVHLCDEGGEQEQRHLTFRNHLRRHPEVAASYAALKRRLAAEHLGRTRQERERYSLGKKEFVEAVLARAGAAWRPRS
jgi:GrpB-like predicted nucleotidyltransferase (UPF0157 family)